MRTLHLDELEGLPVFGTLVWKPVRRTLGVTAFGINAYTAANAGDEVVEDHTELRYGHEEIYVVVRGHATFTVGDLDVDAPAGTLVFLDDPSERRRAVAQEPGTTVLAIGGAPGTHDVSAWEWWFTALPAYNAGDFAAARAILAEGLAAKPADASLLYNLACVEARLGDRDAALGHLGEALAADETLREGVGGDEDLASLRDEPRFPRT